MFPTELFRQLTVNKTPTASQVEGAVAANIDLRIARPFDKKGFHFNYTAKGTYQEASEELSPRLGLYASNTWDTGMGEFGALVGAAYSNRKYRSDGFNTFRPDDRRSRHSLSIPLRNSAPGSDPLCNSFANPNNATGYGNSSQAWPTTVPAGYNFGANGANCRRPADGLRAGRHGRRHLGPLVPRPELLDLAAPRAAGHAGRRA